MTNDFYHFISPLDDCNNIKGQFQYWENQLKEYFSYSLDKSEQNQFGLAEASTWNKYKVLNSLERI